jgi:anti-anti-sigma factor
LPPDPGVPLSDAAFRCEVEPHREAAHVVAIGDLDMAGTAIVDERLSGLRDVGFRRLVLDLRQVTFMDAAGLNVILAWSAQVHADGLIAFQVVPGPAAVQRLFALTGTTGRITFIDGAGAPPSTADGTRTGVVAFLDPARGRPPDGATVRAASRRCCEGGS